MKRLIVIVFILTPVLIFAQRSNPANNLIDLSGLWESKKMINLSEVADSIEYIVLETNSNCFLSDIHQMEVFLHDDRIYIAPVKQDVMVFSSSGKYLFDVGSRGVGPSEMEY